MLIRQAQVKEFDALVSGHVYGPINANLPSYFERSQLFVFKAVDVGTISLAVQVPSIVELEKFLLVLILPRLTDTLLI